MAQSQSSKKRVRYNLPKLFVYYRNPLQPNPKPKRRK